MTKETRLYGLFERQGLKWVRLHQGLAFNKSVAVRTFQSALLAPLIHGIDGEKVKGHRKLRVVRDYGFCHD